MLFPRRTGIQIGTTRQVKYLYMDKVNYRNTASSALPMIIDGNLGIGTHSWHFDLFKTFYLIDSSHKSDFFANRICA